MKRISTALSTAAAAAALMIGSLATAGYAQASNVGNDTVVTPRPTTPVFEPLACNGTTGSEGCGPGWFWRWGERGWACYPC